MKARPHALCQVKSNQSSSPRQVEDEGKQYLIAEVSSNSGVLLERDDLRGALMILRSNPHELGITESRDPCIGEEGVHWEGSQEKNELILPSTNTYLNIEEIPISCPSAMKVHRARARAGNLEREETEVVLVGRLRDERISHQ